MRTAHIRIYDRLRYFVVNADGLEIAAFAFFSDAVQFAKMSQEYNGDIYRVVPRDQIRP